MKHLRRLSFALAFLILTATACGTDDGSKVQSDDSAAVQDTAPATTEPDMTNVLEVPKGLEGDYEVIDILSASGIMASVEELTEEIDVLGKAMYERTLAVEEHMGIDIQFTDVNPYKDTQNIARQSINAGSDDHQMVFTVASHMVNLVNEGLFLPHSELPYIDIEKPWWNKEYIESVSIIADDPYILFGDISYNMLQRTACVFFNINLLETKMNMKPQDLYQLVYDGEWTIDKFTELVHSVYEDVNGNTINDEEDIHGIALYSTNQVDWMAYSSGIEFTTRDEDGYPVIDLYNNRTIDLAEKLYKFQFGSEGVYDYKDNGKHASAFSGGKSVFFLNRFLCCDWFRDMKDDYGILPMPKYDESIDGYHSTVETLVQWGGIPVTVSDPVFLSAVSEVLAYYSRELTTPAYYESTLKLKLTRDDESMAMIDLIMSNRDTDFLYINRLEKLGNVFKMLVTDGQNNFASNYASLEGAGDIALKKLISTFEEAKK